MNILTAAERKQLEESIRESGDQVLRAVENLSLAQFTFRPRHDQWSIAENIEHLSIVDRLVLSQILEVIDRGGPFAESSWKGRDEALFEQVKRPEPALKAPDIISPRGAIQPEKVLLEFKAGCERLSAFAATTEAPLRRHCFPHPVFGELDCYQWLLCSGAHYKRHLLQIQAVMAATDFPSSHPWNRGPGRTAADQLPCDAFRRTHGTSARKANGHSSGIAVGCTG
jgi:hypothetical protein